MTRKEELLIAAFHALRSYQHGNASPELAKNLADKIELILAADAAEDRNPDERVKELSKFSSAVVT